MLALPMAVSPACPRPKAPPIKTQGIKTKLVAFIAEHIDWDWAGRWIEPFLGSGAVLFNLQPPRALIADSCVHLINFHRALQAGEITPSRVEGFLLREGRKLQSEGEAHYYRVRDRFNEFGGSLDFLFLNRACFNGLLRFNRQGEFNTPFCRKPERFSRAYITKICNQVQWAGEVMNGKDWEFICAGWQDSLAAAQSADFIYADPPYAGRYADYFNQWTDADALSLAQALKAAPCPFLLSSWVQNRYRRNTALFECFPGYEIAEFSHFYHLGATEALRHEMQEGLVLGCSSKF